MTSTEGDLALASELKATYARIREQLSRVIVGQDEVLEQLVVAILSGGHSLLVGAPGLAKTLIVKTLADTLGLSFNRVQFTPDLMPSDITGTDVIHENKSSGEREFRFVQGPVFANVVLADEINRTPPKTQAALLEAMQEQQVTVGGHRHKLPEPFFVLATQNPIEQEGTYPLPEAQLDRFQFQILVDYPEEEDEFEIVRRTTGDDKPQVESVISESRLAEFQSLTRRVPIADHVIRFAMQFPRLSRQKDDGPDFIQKYVEWGAGPRASQFMVLAARARAVLLGREFAGIEDVLAVAAPVLRHRIILNFNAEADGVTTDAVVAKLAEFIQSGAQNETEGGRFPKLLRSKSAK
ncbi:MAG: AAA family ATPase [Planctomycetaceae bacterium]